MKQNIRVLFSPYVKRVDTTTKEKNKQLHFDTKLHNAALFKLM